MIKIKKFKLPYNGLTSFEGMPEDVFITERLNVDSNNLTSLKGFPKGTYSRTVLISNNDLRTLEGLPEVIEGNLYLDDNENLRTLKGCPRVIKKSFECAGCPLTDLTYLPEVIGEDLWIGVDGEWFDETWERRATLKNHLKERMEIKGDILISIVRRE